MIGGMTGALVWKEWRTLRGLLIANVVLCLIAPLALSAWSAAFLQDRAGDSMAVLLLSTSLFAVLPIFAAACGATVIAGERSERTIGYLLSRPMSRFRIYATKVAVALSAWLLVALCWWVTTWIVHGGPIVSVGRQMAFEFGEQWMLWVVLSFLVFCCAVMASTWLSQTMTAAAGGVAMAAVFASILYVLWGRTTLETMVGPVWLALQLLALGLMVLCVAALWFSREETHGPFGIAQRPLVLVALLVTTATVGAVPMVVRGMHVDPENLVLTVPRLSGDGSV
ncbi:MAG: ABC transporter permease subunit, partial [Acidobacteriota bacterium]|nr:ABC transporter permease subunit [Acidobacteriota bacterium]